jgi:hypothetical protein
MWEQFPAERKHENCHFSHTHTKFKYEFWKADNFLHQMVSYITWFKSKSFLSPLLLPQKKHWN